RRAAGQFYTHALIGEHLAGQVATRLANGHASSARPPALRVVDPFCGDGRLVAWLLEASVARGVRRKWKVSLWDCEPEAVEAACRTVEATAARLGIGVAIDCFVGDTFARVADPEERARFDVVITNPPWELLKPDAREIREMPESVAEEYVGAL